MFPFSSIGQANKPFAQALGSLFLFLPMTAYAQWAPSGYSGAINTPTAQVLPMGSVDMNWSNNIPEKKRTYPGVGSFGSAGLGMGVVPGLELSTRLAFDGDLDCNLYAQRAACRSWTRDLSFGAKYQLPITLPMNSRIALGATDIGGAATNFRQYYAVWTSRVGAVDASLGLARATAAPYPLMKGAFGSLAWWANEQARLVLEHDSQDFRAGLNWVQPIGDQWHWVGSISRKLTQARATQNTQASFSLVYSWERDHNAQQQRNFKWFDKNPENLSNPQAADRLIADQAAETINPVNEPRTLNTLDRATALAQALQANGFTQVRVGQQTQQTAEALWWVQANPSAWRKSQTTAIASGIKSVLPWMQSGETLLLALSHASSSHRFIRIRSGCDGQQQMRCWFQDGHSFELTELEAPDQTGLKWVLNPEPLDQLQVDLEIGPGLRYAVGTEYGLIDYSLALDSSWEIAVPVVPGLFYQGTYLHPITHSSDYGPGRVFGSENFRRQIQQNMLTWVGKPVAQTYLQASAGYIDPIKRGAQLDMAWLSSSARLKLAGTWGSYHDPETPLVKNTPRYGQIRYELVPGLWAMQLTNGEFFSGDKGWQLSSQHWFSRYRLALTYRQSQSLDARMPLTKFAGFTFSFPIGPDRSVQWGPLAVRGRDLWNLGLETKVGARDNYLTANYGTMPVIRHGLNDMLDYDRRIPIDSAEGRRRLRNALFESQ